MGGIVVLVKLNPNAVSAHFLLSIVLLGFAVWLWVRTKEGDEPLRWSVRTELVWLGRALVAVVAALLWVGTMVTGSGPHAGDIHSKRYAFNIEEIAQFHTDVVWITIGLTFALVLGLRLTTATRAARRRAMELLLIELSQGVIGYTQYFLGDPSQLVIFHVLGATLVWVWTVRAFLALRERGPAAAADASKADRITEKLATR
jgi:cytochrome c oxidase assembly protein subunit 15